MIFESPDFAEHDQPGVFQHIQMFHDADTGRIQLPLKVSQVWLSVRRNQSSTVRRAGQVKALKIVSMVRL